MRIPIGCVPTTKFSPISMKSMSLRVARGQVEVIRLLVVGVGVPVLANSVHMLIIRLRTVMAWFEGRVGSPGKLNR